MSQKSAFYNQERRPGLSDYQKAIFKAHSELFTLCEYMSAADWKQARKRPYFDVLDGMTNDLDKLQFKIKVLRSRINIKNSDQS